MRFTKYCFVVLAISIQMITGCGGGGGGGTTTTPPVADTTAPNVSAFTLPTTANSLTVAVSSFIASDAVGVTGYLITESATAPAAGAAGWSATVPATYTFSGDRSLTAYAWAKDAAGNVSASRTASVSNTKILKISSQSAIPSNVFAGFDLTVTLPVGYSIPTDNLGNVLSSAVFLSGQFAGAIPQLVSYDSVIRELKISYISLNDYSIGEFITILVSVPSGPVSKPTDIFTPWDLSGNIITTITDTSTFY